MKFPRNLGILRNQLDLASVLAVFFLLVIFLMLGPLLYTSGVPIQLPSAEDLPGTDQPSVHVGVDAEGRLYYQNQHVTEAELGARLQNSARETGEPMTLVIHADKGMNMDRLVRLAVLARQAGIHDALLATLPRVVDAPPSDSVKP